MEQQVDSRASCVAVFVDPGINAGVACLYADGRCEVYQVRARNRHELGKAALTLHAFLPRFDVPFGVMEVGWHTHGHSRQSSIGLGLNAGVWFTLPVRKWDWANPQWQKVKGWELEVRARWPSKAEGDLSPESCPDAFDAVGLMSWWCNRHRLEPTARRPWLEQIIGAFKKVREVMPLAIIHGGLEVPAEADVDPK